MIRWFIFTPGFVAATSLVWLLLSGGTLHDVLIVGIALCVVLFFALLYRPTRWYAAAATIILPALLAFALRPTCIPLAADEVERMNPPAAQRADIDLYMNVYQLQPDGGWQECRTQLSRWTIARAWKR